MPEDETHECPVCDGDGRLSDEALVEWRTTVVLSSKESLAMQRLRNAVERYLDNPGCSDPARKTAFERLRSAWRDAGGVE